MSLASTLSSSFDARIRARGSDYFHGRRVEIRASAAYGVHAAVRGSEIYQVRIEFDDPLLNCYCDCPYFDSEGECKHLWAVIQTCDAQNLLPLAASRPDVQYNPLFAPDFDLDFDDPPALAPPAPSWKSRLDRLTQSMPEAAPGSSAAWPPGRELLYRIDLHLCISHACLQVDVLSRDLKKNGRGWNQPKALKLSRAALMNLPDAADIEILTAMSGARQVAGSYLPYGYSSGSDDVVRAEFQLLPPLDRVLLPKICATGRCFVRLSPHSDFEPLSWDSGLPWSFQLDFGRKDKKKWVLAGALVRGEERLTAQVLLVTNGALVFTADGKVALLDSTGAYRWLYQMTGAAAAIEVPDGDQDAFLAELFKRPGLPALSVPPELAYQTVAVTPKPVLKLERRKGWNGPETIVGSVSFHYGSQATPWRDPCSGIFDPALRTLTPRDREAEAAAIRDLEHAGLRLKNAYVEQPRWELAPKHLPSAVRTLINHGWEVHAEGSLIRRPGASRLEVTTGIDWFELHGEVDYDGARATLPELLKALRKGETMVRLDDGTYGMMPEEWLERIGALPGMGTAEGDHVRFRKNQAGLLDAFLAARADTTFDETFLRARERLRVFEGVHPAPQPAGFKGKLRRYQLEGLGWMHFLREFEFGGCLADDMGVGKTPQVLALLETRRELRAAGADLPPSLVVVPKSLVFNWRQEAARFTPALRILDYTGPGRNVKQIANCDVVLATYGTLRRDAADFKDIRFDYAVLDEAQAIKNYDTSSAKAVRLLCANHRLALSGTPIENHLGELWSIFEFLNPGMLGRAFQSPDEEMRPLLAKAVRPFILRRTKAQVATELPRRVEQTLFCEMEPSQRKLYDELRAHYRASLLGRIDSAGLAKSKMHVLEALLRLRQAACHPGLIAAERAGEPSTKLDMLMMQLTEVLEEDHKALVFSQFTSFLAIVRDRLDQDGITYEYLDGRTRDRQARVERFQTDPACRLFLISLKAGGLGLNLTAAEYVFLLDPWWNPAVEAQAIDRAHRIGQSRHVFAYRLIARDTVEEKVLQLQKHKRELADAIIGEDNATLRNLTAEDLDLLLS